MRYLNIFANCKLVKGASMSLLCDLQLRKYYQIPNDMAEVLVFLADHSVEEAIETFGVENKGTIQSYINFVLKMDMGLLDDNIIKELVPLSLEWDAFSEITNVILEFKPGTSYDVAFIQDLLSLNLSAVELRSYEPIPFSETVQLLSLFKYSKILSIKLITAWSKEYSEKRIKDLMETDYRLNTVVLHGAPKTKQVKLFRDSASIVYSQSSLNSNLQCGVIQPSYFSTSIELFSESQLHNTCLNRKLSIDKDGFIKNCPSMKENYGHFLDTSLADILADPGFRKDWFINKDSIEVCKDCEFRHVCTDCRAFTERTHVDKDGRDRSKPLKCGYDPYNNSWEDWSQNPLKQDAISFYQMEDLIDKA
ncbi:grasp-with-spasm system SPASM domain peptide maturase [Sphingobacterium hotanense]|uniref:grasp-with-spasm system SPASM domain peptide maturase n=1 Tax=Sphingobacterium hotanense TaxID=649196 RepID=UPI0011F2E09C|nr:grasp-with-spasm system SPASM domain peptide maturase [Sphingobacterium hotanense]